MKSVATATLDKADFGETPLRLDVLLVYEDFATGLRAREALEHWVHQLEVQADARVNLWRFDLLRDSSDARQAAREAFEADIIVLAAHGQGGLPSWIKTWLQQALASRADRPTALVASLDESARDSAGENPVLTQVEALAQEAGVELFPHFGSSASMQTGLTFAAVSERAHTTSAVLDEILHRHDSYSRWGINE